MDDKDRLTTVKPFTTFTVRPPAAERPLTFVRFQTDIVSDNKANNILCKNPMNLVSVSEQENKNTLLRAAPLQR